MRFTVVSAAQLLAEAKAGGEALAAKASVTFEIQPASNLPAVRVDAERIAQVFESLIGNATKFTPPGGRITIRALPVDAEVHFSIVIRARG